MHLADSSQNSRRDGLVCLALVAVYLVFRLPRLGEMPAFTDETTYARWAQLVLQDPRHNLFVSLTDAKPPLHYWLLAATRWLAADPIYAGRLLSVFLGILVFPALIGLARELARLAKGINPTALAAVAGILLITSPLIAQQQRMVMAEALLLPQAVTIAWLSLRLARTAAEGVSRRKLLFSALALGAVWASALLTKQVFSYFLWGFMPLALVAWSRRDAWLALWRRTALPVAITTVVGLACFIPVVLADVTLPLKARLLYKPAFLPSENSSRLSLAWNHLLELFLPQAGGRLQLWPHNPALPLERGIFYLYLTPPVLLLSVLAIAWMIRRRTWGLAVFLGGWAGAFLGSFLVGAGILVPRFTMLAAVPLLIGVAWLLVDRARWLREKLPAAAALTATVVLGAATLAWPAAETEAAALSWQAPVYTSFDARQYVTEFGGGQVTEQTLLWLVRQANDHPITVVTGSWVGTPNDAIWLYLSDHPNIRLYWDADRNEPLKQTGASLYRLGSNRWADHADKQVTLDFSRPTYVIVPVIHFRDSGKAQALLRADRLPPAAIVQQFTNPTDHFTTMDYAELAILQMQARAPVAAAEDPH